MVSSEGPKDRKDKTIKAHGILLRFDQGDLTGQITFHFKKGEGIVGHEIKEIARWGGSKASESINVFDGRK